MTKMMTKNKHLIAIDGVDASGKQTHAQLLYQHLQKEGYPVRMLSFPAYDQESSALVKLYLSGAFGENPQDVNAYAASSFFAADRFATYRMDWRKDYEDGVILIADRYVSSNMIHQAGKIADEKEKNKFLDWLDNLEHEIYGIPRPGMTVFLDMPPAFGRELMRGRENKFDANAQKDIHERNDGYLEESYKNACAVAQKYGWQRVACVEENTIRTIEEIQAEIYQLVKEIL